MKRTGPVAARQLKKHGQMRMQTLAMRRVQQAAWQMARSPDDAGMRRYWEEVVAWRCDDEWREAYLHLVKDDPKNSTKWKRPLTGRATYWERSFTRLLGDASMPKLKACKNWTEWRSLTEELEHVWHALLNLKSSESTATAACDAPVEREKRPQDDSDPWTMSWALDKCRRLENLGDSKVVISWINGTWEVKSKEHVEVEPFGRELMQQTGADTFVGNTIKRPIHKLIG